MSNPTKGPALTQLPVNLTFKDPNGLPVTDGTAAVVISDVSANYVNAPGTVLLSSTNMPYSGADGVYAYTAAASLYQPGSTVRHVVTGKDSGGNVVVTLTAIWQDSGA